MFMMNLRVNLFNLLSNKDHFHLHWRGTARLHSSVSTDLELRRLEHLPALKSVTLHKHPLKG